MAGPDVLTRIALHVAKRLDKWKEAQPAAALRTRPLYGRPRLDFEKALTAKGRSFNVISEVKFASPSESFLRPKQEANAERAAQIASGYAEAGAAAISVLTERNFFAGDPDFLVAARGRCPGMPLLMKDFVVDAYQLELARSCGADAVLLIAALLQGGLATMIGKAADLGLAALVEVHTEEELELAKRSGARIVGVNSRDLRTLRTDLGVARRLAPALEGCVAVAESGLRERSDLEDLARRGYHAFLIGTSFMKAEDPAAALRALIG